ncbi:MULTISPECIES: acyltransferase family protein [unclassified Pseudoclavibacter]|uniref:acyltransferase family protein n=1 Tax=unclassified Pseudoclavibacter TaxID=2615177 RepID=UPI001BA7D6FB|nr:acyltransferase [Pseudoclavibacter sp. Marseille-Q4354]MBS3180135.1 acyltransferase [Pseudoclavibacter sp. Marseille-Q4354]
MTQTFREALSTRDNALNFVRLLLATAVIVAHALPMNGFGDPLTLLGIWAVNGFFAISGYLIAGSRMRLTMRPFMVNRALRIFPAFWVCLVAIAAVFAPVSALLSGSKYEITDAIRYVAVNFGLWIHQKGIAETITTLPIPDQWNSPFWTLIYEFCAYICAALLLSLAIAKKRPLLVVSIAFAAVLVLQLASYGPLDLLYKPYLQGVRLAGFFLAGMLVYFAGSRWRPSWWLIVGSALLLALMLVTGLADTAGQLPAAILLLGLGARLPVRLGAKNDISYGMYIWAWPLQQLLVLLGLPALGPYGAIALSIAVTIPVAWASWKYIEEPAMRLRKRLGTSAGPRRRENPPRVSDTSSGA